MDGVSFGTVTTRTACDMNKHCRNILCTLHEDGSAQLACARSSSFPEKLDVHGDLKDRLSHAAKSRLNATYATFQLEMDYLTAQKCTSHEFERNVVLRVCVQASLSLSVPVFVLRVML